MNTYACLLPVIGLALLLGATTEPARTQPAESFSVQFPAPAEGLPAGWQALPAEKGEADRFAVLEEGGVRFLRATRTAPGTLQFGLTHACAIQGRAAFEVKVKWRTEKKAGVLFGFRPLADPASQQAFSATGLLDVTPEWQEVTATMRGDLAPDHAFFFNVSGPVRLDIAAFSIRPIPLSDYHPATTQPTPREPAARAAFEGWIKETLAAKPLPPVLFLGDSITDAWNNEGKGLVSWTRDIAPLGAANWGIGANRIEHVLWQVQNSPLGKDYRPRVIVLLIGINNLFKVQAPADLQEGMANLLQEIQSRSPDARILLLGIYPVREKPTDPLRARIREINRLYEAMADGKRIVYLDIGDALLEPDGTIKRETVGDFTHPTNEGYTRLAARLVPVLQRLLGATP